jgi:hypothetical protein
VKPHDELVNTLWRDAETFDQFYAAHRPIERVEQSFRRRTRDELAEGHAP